jgi:glutamyl-tRNA synthetase
LFEGLLNYLALLGWAIAEDRDVFRLAEMVEVFDILRVNANPARFDPRKCEAINGAHIRLLDPKELAEQLVPFLARAGLVNDPPLPAQQERLEAATPLIQERINTLSEAVEMLGFLFRRDAEIVIEPDAGLTPASAPALDAAAAALTALPTFDKASIEQALRTALVDRLGLKPRLAFAPVRAAVTGRRISPPLFESIELLGRPSTLARIASARASLDA